jgi:hypothetical protein
MSLNEVRLVLMVEDPRAAQQREQYGVEVESGVSRGEILAALTDVTQGRVPADKLALRQLVKELQQWPYLENDDMLRGSGPSPYAEVTNTGASRQQRMAEAQARASTAGGGRVDEVEEAQDLSDFLPKWVGWSSVYLISAIPARPSMCHSLRVPGLTRALPSARSSSPCRSSHCCSSQA